MTAIDEIKARIDIVDLVSETVQLRRSGKNFTGFCPFHPNTRTPAFVVFPESGTWRCFGQCNEGGDIFRFVMKKEGWDFSEALRYLADKAGVQLKPPTPEDQAAAEEHQALRALLEEAATFFRHQLLNTPAGHAALRYLRGRNLKDETIEAFGLGYAPHTWDAATLYFKSKGYSEADLLAAGLVTQREAGEAGEQIYDRFRHRVMFPIRDERGRMAGFGARILNPDDVPKFLNSPQTAIFDKGRLLYGLDKAHKAIRSQDQAVIVEGYLDVIALHQAGYANAVSPMGTALTEAQLYLLKRFTRRIVLALDPDAAGYHATMRGLQLARHALDHEQEPYFDARGLLSHEARLQADLRVTTLPEGMDPDDVVSRDPSEWEHVLASAKPVVSHVMDTLAAARDLDDPKDKREIAGQVLPLIADLPSPIERDTYRQKLARLIKVDERTLLIEPRARAARARRTVRAQLEIQLPTIGEASGYNLETFTLGMLLRRPDLLYQVDRHLQQAGLGRLSEGDFLHADHKKILKLIQASVDQDYSEPRDYVFNNLSIAMMESAERLLVRSEGLDPGDDKVLEDMLRALLDLRHRNLHQDIEYLRFLIEEAQHKGDIKATDYQQIMVQHTQTLRRLDLARRQYTGRAGSPR